MDRDYTDLSIALEEAFTESPEEAHGMPGNLGYTVSGVYTVVDPDDLAKFYVHFPDGTFVRAYHYNSVPPMPDFPVWVKKNELDEPYIVGPNLLDLKGVLPPGGQSSIPLNSNIGIHTHEPGSLLFDWVSERRFRFAIVRVSDTPGLNVTVNRIKWTDEDGLARTIPQTIVDMTSHVPGAGLWRWVLVGVDLVNLEIDTVAGSTYPIATEPGFSQLNGFAIGDLEPLAFVRVVNGMTAIDNEVYFVDWRTFGIGKTSGAGAAQNNSVIPWLGL